MAPHISCAGATAEILLVEDNPGDVRLVKEILSDAKITNPIHVATGGQEAIDFVHQRGECTDAPRPLILLLDWRLSRVDGAWVLRNLDDDFRSSRIPVVILTGARMETERIVPSDLDVDGHLTKPIDPDEFCSLVGSFERFSITIE